MWIHHNIFKKYKIDSLQFVQSNVYYASNYEEYKVLTKLLNELMIKSVDSLVVIDVKKRSNLTQSRWKKVVSIAKDTLLPFKKEEKRELRRRFWKKEWFDNNKIKSWFEIVYKLKCFNVLMNI
jgi:hypothetical protein